MLELNIFKLLNIQKIIVKEKKTLIFASTNCACLDSPIF